VSPANTGPVSRCRFCHQRILWAHTAASDGKSRMPLDPDPTDTGNVYMNDRGQAVVESQPSLEFGGERSRYMPHFATCPNYEPPVYQPRK